LAAASNAAWDVVNEPVGANDGLLGIAQGTAHAHAAPIRQRSGPRPSKKRISRCKRDAVCSLKGRTDRIDIGSDNL